jgi:hypothetical protein
VLREELELPCRPRQTRVNTRAFAPHPPPSATRAASKDYHPDRAGDEFALEFAEIHVAWPPRAALRILALFALLLSLALVAAPSADASPATFIKAYGWGVSDGASQLETCTTTCQTGIPGGGAGQLGGGDEGRVATDSSGDVYVADTYNNRIDEFSAAGAFIKAYGWGIANGMNQFETCTSTCQTGIGGGRVGQFYLPTGVATNSSGDVYVFESSRIDEFSAAGAVSPAPATPRPCTSRQLVISLGTLSAGLGHLALPIRFRDRGGTCSLRGFPRVDGLSASGRVIIRAKRALKGYFGRWRIATITLKNGQTASALLEGLDPAFFSRRPRSSRSLRIMPPNASYSVLRRTSYPLCYLTIHPVVAGPNGGGA